MNETDDLAGCRVMVVEDDAMLSMMLQELLGEMGCQVADTASRMDEAMRKCQTVDFDVALLDINLRGERTFMVAEALVERGRPIVIATGYTETALPQGLRKVPLLQKPYRRQELDTALRNAIRNR